MPRKEINIPVGTIVGKDTKGTFEVVDILNTKDTEKIWADMGKAKPHDPGYKIQFKCGKTYYTLKTQVWKCMSPNDVGWRTCYGCDGTPGKKCRWDQQNSHAISVTPIRDAVLEPGTVFGDLRLLDFAFNAKRHNYYEFECIKCGVHTFHMTPTNTSDIQSCLCQACVDVKYRGPRIIKELLDTHNVSYEKEYRFTDCAHKKPLPFDFAVFNPDKTIKTLIEYDGEQHSKFIPYFHGDEEGFELQKTRDQIKTGYCLMHNIPLIRIPYTEFDHIEDILRKNHII